MHNFSKCGPAYVLLVLHTVEPTIISSLCGRLREVVAYGRWSFTGGGRLREVVVYRRWSLIRGGRLREVVAYGRWSLTGGGHLPEMVAYQRSGLRGGFIFRVIRI